MLLNTIEGIADGNICVAYTHGKWSYIDFQAQFEALATIEPSLLNENKSLWDLCLQMTSRREGAL